jgi:hypothetical protein
MHPDPDLGGPKTCRSGGSGSATLVLTLHALYQTCVAACGRGGAASPAAGRESSTEPPALKADEEPPAEGVVA